jgi:hypothetical protein
MSSLNTMADYAETELSLSDRRAMHPSDNIGISELAPRVAATIRQHCVYLSGRDPDFDSIGKSLLNGYIGALQGRWDKLAVIDASPKEHSLWAKLAPRLLLSAGLLVAAYASSRLDFIATGKAADYLRTTLLIAAFFNIFAPDTGRVRDAFLEFGKPRATKP